MDETQKEKRRKQVESKARERVERLFHPPVESDTRCGKKRLVYVPPTAPSKLFRIIKWGVLLVAFGTLLAQFIFDVPAVVGTVAVLMLIVWASLLRKQ